MKKKPFLIALSILLILTLFCGLYVNDYYHADASALAALSSDASVSITISRKQATFAPSAPNGQGFLFYPGGKVEFTAYAPLLRRLAKNGVTCVVIKMPWNLAVLSPNAADAVFPQFPEISQWYIGGHSLGGSMAANYASSHPDLLKGLVLLASYSTKDLHQSGLRVLSLYGNQDGVLNLASYIKNEANLPEDCVFQILDGANHAGFGSYGPQKGDGECLLPEGIQIEKTAQIILEFLDPQI